jgi:tetratricopeptide (TPR) repeat protein
MGRRALIGIVLGGISLFLPVRAAEDARRPAWESHVTGDAAARAGIAAVEKGEFAEAVRALEFALQKPRFEVAVADVYEALGRAYAGLDRTGTGESRKHEALVCQGLAHRLRGDLEKAGTAFAAAEKARPDYALAYESLGSLRLTQGRPQEAILQLERAVELDPAKAITRSNLAIAHAQVGHFDEADLQVQQAERLGYPKVEQLKASVKNLRARSNVGK